MKSLRLQEVMQTVQTYFDRQFSGKQFWCQAEVMQIKQHKQRVYIDLVEYDASGVILAKIKAIVREIDLLGVYLQAHGLSRMDELIGKVICFEATCGFHAQWGLSLHIQSLSHEFARGQLHNQQEKIRSFLQGQRIYTANKEQQIGLPPLRLAVISSPTSEGFRDFVTILEQSERNIQVELFAASIHGESAKQEVAEQIHRIAEQHTQFTAVIITRGGGGGEGLVWQNDQAIAEAICRLPLPVILATGHTSDRSILDEIVRYAAKTPSDAAHLLLDGIAQMSARLERIQEEIEEKIYTRLEVYVTNIDQRLTWIQVDAKRLRLRVTENIQNRRLSIQGMGPEQQSRRGYALLRDMTGRYVSKDGVKTITQGDRLYIEIYDQTFEVEVIQRKER